MAEEQDAAKPDPNVEPGEKRKERKMGCYHPLKNILPNDLKTFFSRPHLFEFLPPSNSAILSIKTWEAYYYL